MDQQMVLDHRNNAQYRTCADARIVIKNDTISVTAGTTSYDLPDDLISLRAVNVGATQLPNMLVNDAIAFESDSRSANGSFFYLLGRTLNLQPTPSEDTTLTILYIGRPEPLASDLEFEVSGDPEAVIELRVLADTLMDDRQDELAAEYEVMYAEGVRRLRRATRGHEPPRRVLTKGDVYE